MLVAIKKYSPELLDSTVSVLADAFVTNPLHISAFGPERMDQNRLFFRIGLQQMFTGHAFVALVHGEVRGYMHFAASPTCLPPPEEIPAATTTLFKPLGEAVPRVVVWFARWCRLDPEAPHAHLGPIGISPTVQGQGVGTALMKRYIDYLKLERVAGYLETDRLENVQFYKKFGFTVQREEQLIGTPTWYMWRPLEE
ncbi:MAG TPA: GNAT family N-acetyltransferase [Methylomirabilota bacterium]|nr:GNAT family N-acetyltransferase [Methylomirabilota bacterium]